MRLATIQHTLSIVLLVLAGKIHALCKATPGSEWPSSEEWTQFNASLGGVLLMPPPPGGVCHEGQPNYNISLCSTVATEWVSDWSFHVDNPISNGENNWNNDSCLPDPAYPCSGEGYPIYVVNATTVEHVQKAVNFARERNIRLNVKSSGHDFLGRSVAPNSLSIWLHNMHGIQLHESFTPQSGNACDCTPPGLNASGPAITFMAGDNQGLVYAAANTIGMAVPVAGAPTVCYGGYITGGGHSLTGARYGLGADLILELTVVTPDGKLVVANTCENPDLFWALRGGGGATFGVITSFTLALNPDLPTVQVLWGAALVVNNSVHFYDAAAYAFSQYPTLVDAGWAGYGSTTPSNTTLPGTGSAFGVLWNGFGRTLDQFVELIEPIEEYINRTWPGEFVFGSSVANWTSYYAYWSTHPDTSSPVGRDIIVGSRLLDKAALNNPNLSYYLAHAMGPGGGLAQYLIAGPGVHDKPLSLNSVCPAWRTAYSHTVTGAGWLPFDTAAMTESINSMNDYIADLVELAPNTGAYVNEADPFEENYHEVFWGSNYPRLLAIKKAVDPSDVFWCRACVGNEGWTEVGDMLCTV